MNCTAGTLPDLLPGQPRNSFASMKKTRPITLSWGIDWPTSAISGGFQPLNALGRIRHILVDTPGFSYCISRQDCKGWREYLRGWGWLAAGRYLLSRKKLRCKASFTVRYRVNTVLFAPIFLITLPPFLP